MSPGSLIVLAFCCVDQSTSERPHDATAGLELDQLEGVRVQATGAFWRSKEPLTKVALLEVHQMNTVASPEPYVQEKPYVVGPEDTHIAPDSSQDAIFTKMKASDKYTAIDEGTTHEHIVDELKWKDDATKVPKGYTENHQNPDLAVSSMYDDIRKRLQRQEKMLNTNEFSVKNYADSGESALNENQAYHGMLSKYVQGLYQMAAGANKLTHDTYIRHAGIATHLYDTVTESKKYYDKEGDGIEATVHKTDGYDMMNHHKDALDAFKTKGPLKPSLGDNDTPLSESLSDH